MRIAIDIQGYQSEESSLRGIGRYSINIVKSIIRRFPENEYILFANSSLRDVRGDFIDELSNTNCKVSYYQWYSIGPRNQDFSENNFYRFSAIQLRTYALGLINADCILITSHFEGFLDNILTDIDKNYSLPPIVSIIYDLIPLLNPDTYLNNNPLFKNFYYKKLSQLEGYDGLVAISNSSSNEAKKYLNIDSSSIYNISSACDNNLFAEYKTNDNCDESIISLGDFLLYSGAGDTRKNLLGLIKAYSNLSENLRSSYKLILVGKLFPSEKHLLENCIQSCNLSKNQVIILGYVSDEYLVKLYQNCKLFIFPSFHEGFGLPVLEAMTCGAPVVTSNTSSLPEIVGLEDAMFDPFDIFSITNLINRALTDSKFNHKLIENSKIRSSLFSWDSTAEKLVTSLEIIINKKVNSNNNRLNNSYKLLLTNLRESLLNSGNFKIDTESIIKQISAAITLIDEQSKKYIIRNLDFSKNIKWRVEGPFDSNYSLAILNRNFIERLSQSKLDVYLHCTEGPGEYQPDISFLKHHKIIFDLYNRENIECDIVSRNLYPPRVDDFKSQLKLLHSYGWEETEFPREWVDNFNKYLDGMTVMSYFVKNILINNGVSIPIKVCGLGLDHIKYLIPESDLNLKCKKYRFLHISSCFPRKGIMQLLNAYGIAFNSHDDVSLIIKTSPNPHNEIFKILDDFKSKKPDYPHVLILDEDFSDTKIKALYKYSDALIAPSLGEGFGLPIGEAMILGLPVITTAWSGQLDFCNTDNSWLIDFEYKYAQTHFGLESSVWAEPIVDNLVDKMLEVYNASLEELDFKTKNAKDNIQNFTWQKVADINIDFAKLLSEGNSSKSIRIGWISTWNSRCGIASYSQHLVNFINEQITIFAPNESINFEDHTNVRRCWDLDVKKEQNLDNLYQEIINNKITTTIIQFNYGFFNFQTFSEFLDKLINKKIKIIIFLHSTTDPNNKKSLIDLKQSLSKCHRIFVHSPSDLNRLKKIGLMQNSYIFPHGIVDFDISNYSQSNALTHFSINHKINIATYGFCLPNKGFRELIKSIKILSELNYDISLSIYTAIHSSELSIVHFQELTILISQLKLEHAVKLDNFYYSDIETLRNLATKDLIIFPYQSSKESSSASVRHGLSAGPPVLVTPSSIFEDLANVVHTLPGTSPKDIADGIHNWFDQGSVSNQVNLNKRLQHWRKQHRFSVLGRRLEGTIRSLEFSNDFN